MKHLLQTTLGRRATPTENNLRLFGFSVLAGLCVACGQKGPPLAPIVYLPRPVSELTAKRVEGDIVLQFKVPSANADGTTPADLERIEVYAHTGPLPTPADFLKYGTLVQSIDVKQPPEPTTEEQGATGATGLPTVLPAVASDAKAGAPSGAEVGATEPAAPKQGAEIPAKAEPAAQKQSAEAAAKAGNQLPATSSLVEQGWATSVRETLTEAHREIGPMPPTRAIVPVVGAVPIETLETPGTVNFPLPPVRSYTVVAVSESRNRRVYAGPIRVPLVSPLESPGEVSTSYTPEAIVLSWPGHPEDIAVPAPVVPAAAPSAAVPVPAAQATAPSAAVPVPAPSAEVPAPVLPPASPSVELPAPGAELPAMEARNQETAGTHEIYAAVETDDTVDAPIAAGAAIGKPQPPPTPRFGYNVYEVSASAASPLRRDKPAAPAAPTSAPDATVGKPVAPVAPSSPIVPLNTALLTAPTFKDTRVEFGTERCYAVRRVEMVGTIAIESGASPAICLTPVDTFPPAAPASLAHVASGTEVSLIWEASTEADLAGYLVLRGEAPGDKLAPLTAAPISDASYVDTSVRRNRSYVYEIVAVDRSGNQSAPSNRVEETIR